MTNKQLCKTSEQFWKSKTSFYTYYYNDYDGLKQTIRNNG